MKEHDICHFAYFTLPLAAYTLVCPPHAYMQPRIDDRSDSLAILYAYKVDLHLCSQILLIDDGKSLGCMYLGSCMTYVKSTFSFVLSQVIAIDTSETKHTFGIVSASTDS